MNLTELLIALLVVAFGAAIILRLRKSGAPNPSTTNLLLAVIIGMGGFGFYLYTESENREAVRAADMSRCWYIFTGSACSSRIAADAGDRLSRGY